MGETTTLERNVPVIYPPAAFDESVVETSPEIETTKAGIENTRAEMSETINAIKEQLSPKRLVEEAKEAASDAVSEKVSEVTDAVKDKVSDIAHGAGEIAHNVVATVTNAAQSLGETVSGLTDTAKEKIGHLTHPNTGSQEASAVRYPSYRVDSPTNTLRQTGDILMDTVKENPIPAALVGVGLGWLLVDAALKYQRRKDHPLVNGNGYNGYTSETYSDAGYGISRGASYGSYSGTTTPSIAGSGRGQNILNQAGQQLSETGEKISDVVGDARTKVTETAQDLQAKASDTISDLSHKASDIAHNVQEKASETTSLVQDKATALGQATQTNVRKAAYATQDFVTDNPIAAGGIALLVGAVIGLALPSTDPENKLMGTYRDKLADQAGQQAQDLFGKVQSVAGEAINVAKDQFADVKESVQTQISDAKSAVTDSVQSSLKSNGFAAA